MSDCIIGKEFLLKHKFRFADCAVCNLIRIDSFEIVTFETFGNITRSASSAIPREVVFAFIALLVVISWNIAIFVYDSITSLLV